MTPSQAFFKVHRDLPREGPGLPADVHWALKVAGTPEDARILDAASGPGADTVTLAEARPDARIDAVDLQSHFVEDVRTRCASFGTRVVAREGDYTQLFDRYDLIWCAGAAYFKGFLTVLGAWRDHLTPDGAVAFSEPAFVTEPPSDGVTAFWDGEGDIRGLSDLEEMLAKDGWRIEDQRWIIGEGWEAYYGPQAKRIEMLKADNPHPALAKVIEQTEREIALWQENKDQIAYSLFVVRPE
jgi:hypothetical protein